MLQLHARLAAAALGAPRAAARLGEHAGTHGGDAERGESVLETPLRLPGEPAGSLRVAAPAPRRWTAGEAELLAAVAEAAGEQLVLLRRAHERAEEVRAEAERMAGRMRAVAAAAAGVLGARDLRRLHDVLRDATRSVLPCDALTVALYDPAAHGLAFLGSDDGELFEPGELVPVDGTPSERVIRERRSLVTLRSDDPVSWGACAFGSSRRSESVIRSPILDGDEVLGVLSVQSYTPGLYGLDDVEVLEAVAALAATAVHNLRHLAGREAAVAALRESEERHRALFEQVPAGVFFYDPELRVTAFNERFHAMTNLPRERLVGYRIREIQDPRVLPTFEPVLRGETASYEGAYLTPTGVEMWIVIRVAPLRDPAGRVMGGVGVVEDHTLHRRAEQERVLLLRREQLARADAEMGARRARFLAEASEMFTTSLDPAATLESLSGLLVPRLADSCIVYLLDAEGGVQRLAAVHADPERQARIRDRLLRYAPELDCLLPPVAHVLRTGEARFVAMPEARRGAENPRCEERRGDLDPATLLVAPLRARGRILGALSLGFDAGRAPDPDDRALAEEVARRAALAVDNAQLHGEVQKALQTRKRVMQAVSHDLRNPLTSIMLNATSLLSPRLAAELGDPVREAIGTVALAAEQMERLIQDLLDVTRLEAGHFAIDRAPQHIPLLVGSGLALLLPLAERKRIRLVSTADDVAILPADAGRVLQVLSNLVENAIKFTPEGGEVRVAVEDAGEGVRVSVADGGPGIDEAHRPHLFTPFWQAVPSGRRSAGLGLTIARGIVEAHGGRIGVEAPPGGGSVFHFTLPYRAAGPAPAAVPVTEPPAPAAPAVAPPPERGGAAAPGSGAHTVLVVDDNEAPRNALAYVLRHAGFAVVEAADGEEGVREARRCVPGLVLMDLSMPVMDGWAATRQIRRERLGGRVPVVAVTAQILSQMELSEAELLFDEVLPKPVTAARLLETVERLLAGRYAEPD